MADVQDWIIKGAKEWGGRILSENLGRYKLAALAGISNYRAEQIIAFVRRGDLSPSAKAGSKRTARIHAATEDFSDFLDEAPDEDDVPIEAPRGKALENHELLCHDDYVYNPETDTYTTFTRVTAPKPMVLSGDKHRAIISAYSNWDGEPATINQICREFQIPRPWLVEYLRIHGVTHDSEPFSREEIEGRDVEDMVEEALQAKRQSLYRKYEVAKWRETQAAADKWHAFEETVLTTLLDRFTGREAAEVPRLSMKPAAKDYCLIMSPTDFHWGMYSWRGEVNDPYDFDTAEGRLIEHTENIVSQLPGRPEKILYTIGSDFFHVDGDTNHTTKGTPQDIAGTPTEILVTGTKLNIRYIDLLRQIAPVEIVFLPGNHDQMNTRALMLVIASHYHGVDDVSVNETYKHRVYLKYGNTLMGFHHGDKTKVKDLGACMSKEARSHWSDTTWHLWFGGHLHTHHVQEAGAIIHYQLPSLAGQDRWHAGHGYVDSDPSLVAYLIGRHEGPFMWLRSSEATEEQHVKEL